MRLHTFPYNFMIWLANKSEISLVYSPIKDSSTKNSLYNLGELQKQKEQNKTNNKRKESGLM